MQTSFVPSAWRDASVYPIPKPTEWHCFLKNTRPITLFETARKLLTKLMYRRLSAILVQYKVLKGGNFAGLPGGSCDPPIIALEAILQDAKSFNKPLFIFQQDISKAFDSIDTNMLRLAILRLKIPARFVDLTLDLLSNRFNSIITAFGNTSPYKVQIGIDQGEVISPLLWVIYIDPLLSMLHKINPSPYQINSDLSKPSVDISSLCFMDDTNLFATSSDALTIMLNFAQEFYNFNNTKINFSKAILICNRDPHNNEHPLPTSPIPFTFNIVGNSFNITPLPQNDSFRFLGVWFTLSLSSTYVKTQCLTEYRLFAAKLTNKRLTSDQLTYLHNMVLLPKVCYRLKASTLSEDECTRIMAPFKKTLKNSLSLAVTLPDSFTHSTQFLNLVHLFQRSITDKVTIINNILSADNQYCPKLLLEHRFYNIMVDLNLQHSPLLYTNFSAFCKTVRFRTDFIFRLISFASKLGITFAKPLPAPQNSTIIKHTPIHELFHEFPDVYTKNLYLFKKHNIT